MESFKYPRTYHLPFSRGLTTDDKITSEMDSFKGMTVVVTEKLDGENTTLYSDGKMHARSIDGKSHSSRNWVKQFHASITHLFPQNIRICGENVFAKHSLFYDNLKSYFYGFSAWEAEMCLSWKDTVEIFDSVGIVYPNILYYGEFDIKELEKLAMSIDPSKMEGFVVRNVDSFNIDDFNKNVVKYVRSGHVQTDKHWAHSEIIPNKLK